MPHLKSMSLKQIQKIVADSKQLHIVGNSSQLQSPNKLDMSQYSGVIEYHPEELVITVKAGTTLKQLNHVLAENNQVTSFNVDSVEGDTIGSAYAKGSADLRDAILGIKIIDGQGRLLTFGGQVMKNVAGYDVARLLVGSKGQLAIICEISFKVIPKVYGTKKKSIVFTTLKPNEKNSIATKKCINHGLKNIFDPLGVFI